MTAGREALLIVLACALLYLTPAVDVPFHTRGEPREGLVVREILTTGEWLVPARPDGEPARKPPLYYWLAALPLRLLPARPELALRLPSTVLATGAVLGTWATARTVFGPPAALPAALVLACAVEWTRAASSARVDMTLAAALTAVLAGWTLAAAGNGRRWLVLAGAGAALGTLAKGPVAVVLPALAAAGLLVVARDPTAVRSLRPATVLGVAVLVAGAWYAVALLRGGEDFVEVVARENVSRFLAGEGHEHGIGYLLPLGLVGLLPWTPLLPLAAAAARQPERGVPARLAASWVVTGVVFFSLASSKRSVYLLPLYPAVALLVGAGAAAPPRGGALARAARACAAAYAPAVLALALLALGLSAGLDPTAIVRPFGDPTATAGAAALAAVARRAAVLLGVLALASALATPGLAGATRRADWRRIVLTVAALTVAWTAAFAAVVHPAIARERSPRAFLARVARLVPADAPLFAFFPPDPGLRFYAPRPLRRWRTATDPVANHLLLWEDEWRRVGDAAGRPLAALAVSDSRDPHRGHLVLVSAPAGSLRPVPERAGPPPASGTRAGR
jgi:4-amino-4-deoxy-L-arabinose transferase-like glycosyltransferase